MSSIHVINKGQKKKPGGGLPFYNKVEHVFSASNNEFNSIQGIWPAKAKVVPTFQIWVPQDTFVSVTYLFTKGDNNFVPIKNYTSATLDSAISVREVDLNGTPTYIWMSTEAVPLVPPVPNGRYLIELVLTDGITEATYYSEEFIIKDCC